MRKIIFALIGIMVLLVGCEGGETKSTANAFIGGTDAVDFNFMEETPPAEVYDSGQQPFEVTLNLQNKGEYDVAREDIKVKLSGFYPGDFSSPTTEKNPDENLAKSYIDPDGTVQAGTITYVNFGGFNFAGKLVGNNKYTIRAELCYKYGTNALADLCVLDDLTSTEEDVCKVNDNKAVESSSAPVKVDNFIESVAGTRKVQFSFDITETGTGLVSKLGSSCDSELTNKNKVWVEVTSGIGSITCSGFEGGSSTTGYTTLYNGKRKVICYQDLTGVTGNFVKKVDIVLKYDYKEHKESDILVKHVATG